MGRCCSSCDDGGRRNCQTSSGDLAATLFWRFGFYPETEIRDPTDRPFKLAEGKPLQELFL
jgi:hypothetical protein